jgi:alpha-1,2-mannosyltransferase
VSSVIGPPRAAFRPVVWASGLGALAFAVRLVAVLRGGGLFGRIGYDGSVYYASASALTHGLLPYRDFLLLHPPGIALALLPFAALGRVTSDADAYALARLAWFGLGAVSSVLVFAILRSRGLWPAVVAATFYAVFVPAVTSEHTTSLEAVGSVCLLGAVALLTSGRDLRSGPVGPLVAAGALVGFSTGTKIWGAAVVLALVAWSARRVGLRRASLVLAGAVGATVVVCLPFFLAAPGPMWRMVVEDQLGRRRVPGGLGGRLVDIAGLSELRGPVSTRVLAVVALVVLAVLLVLAVRGPVGRLAALLLVVTGAVLMSTPPWSVAYTGLAAPALALLVGSAVPRLDAGSSRRRWVVALAVAAGLVAYAVASLPGLTFGSAFPGRSLEQVLAQAPGCVTTDDPIVLIETGALQRNFDLRCPVVLDLSGYSYDLQPEAGEHIDRPQDAQWQQYVLTHLGSGRTAVVVRFRGDPGLSPHTRAVVSSWPVVADVGGYQLRRPLPQTSEQTR